VSVTLNSTATFNQNVVHITYYTRALLRHIALLTDLCCIIIPSSVPA